MVNGESALTIVQAAGTLHEWGGIERYVAYAHSGLTERGHRVIVAASAKSALAQRVPYERVETRGKHDPRGLAAYLRLFRRVNPDVVHVHFSPDFLTAGLAARMAHVPIRIMTRHLAERWRPGKARLYHRLWPRIIPVSDAVGRALIASGIPAAALRSAKAGVPEFTNLQARESVRAEWEIEGNGPVFATFGRLTPEKGTEDFVEAMREVPNATGLIFGDGPESDRLRRVAGPNVRLMGRIADVGSAMAAVDALIIPSRWDEAFPYSALEAMSVGTPIVAAEVGGLPELVTNGENGRLYIRGDIVGLREILTNWNPARATEMGIRARAIQQEKYTLPHFAHRLESAYHPPRPTQR